MISIVDASMQEYRGLSTDTKPATEVNGSKFVEIDTGAVYYYDEDSGTWITPSAS